MITHPNHLDVDFSGFIEWDLRYSSPLYRRLLALALVHAYSPGGTGSGSCVAYQLPFSGADFAHQSAEQHWHLSGGKSTKFMP